MSQGKEGEQYKPATDAAGAGSSILLVDDDIALRTSLRYLLEMHGYRIREAENRQAALSCLAADPEIEVILLDLGMPPAEHKPDEGLAVIRAATAQMHSAKILVLTGQDEEQSALAAIREGAFDFLAKPARVEDILQAIKRALLFYRKERALAAEGMTRLQLNAVVADGLKAVREEAEEKLVRQVLKDTGFNIYQSAAKLGLKRESIYYFLKKFEISRDDV